MRFIDHLKSPINQYRILVIGYLDKTNYRTI